MNKGKLDKVLAAYKEHLRKAHTNNPGKFHWPITKLDSFVEGLRGTIVAKDGLGGVDIKTPTWKATAKQFGIDNTYKAWGGYLNA